ncbi:MAG: stalk domain-containing protein, partial [Oscillospiraceae bacterium]
DLAFALSGSEKQFDVGWDGAKNAISLTNGKAYTVVGGELVGKGSGDKSGTPTASKIYLDGKEVSFTAYNIDGNNYFKLRDIGQTFNVGVTYDSATNTIVIDTAKGYTAA